MNALSFILQNYSFEIDTHVNQFIAKVQASNTILGFLAVNQAHLRLNIWLLSNKWKNNFIFERDRKVTDTNVCGEPKWGDSFVLHITDK